ncbi:phosphatidylinositol 4-kinase, partial [Atractiella rhizophila]
RHNGNILIDKEGHVIHIDFGFMLSNSPGSIGFEAAPFKCTSDYVEILGGLESDKFKEFKLLFKESFKCVRKHAERLITIVELMQKDSQLPCFQAGEQTANLLRDRFQLHLPQAQLEEFLERLIHSSVGSVYSKLYDDFQFYSQGVF